MRSARSISRRTLPPSCMKHPLPAYTAAPLSNGPSLYLSRYKVSMNAEGGEAKAADLSGCSGYSEAKETFVSTLKPLSSDWCRALTGRFRHRNSARFPAALFPPSFGFPLLSLLLSVAEGSRCFHCPLPTASTRQNQRQWYSLKPLALRDFAHCALAASFIAA